MLLTAKHSSSFSDVLERLARDDPVYLAGPNLLKHSDSSVASLFESIVKDPKMTRKVEVKGQCCRDDLLIKSLKEACLWAGRNHQRTLMHFDLCHNLLHVLEGEKGYSSFWVSRFVGLNLWSRCAFGFSSKLSPDEHFSGGRSKKNASLFSD